MKCSVGDKFPNLQLVDAFGNAINVEDIDAEKTIIWVMRYIGCTICQLDIHKMAEQYDKVKEKGAKLFVVLQSDSDHVKKELEQKPLPFTIICDPEKKIYEELEVKPARNKLRLAGNIFRVANKLNETKALGITHGDYEGDELQLPALFILNSHKVVIFSHYANSLADMPSVEEMISLL